MTYERNGWLNRRYKGSRRVIEVTTVDYFPPPKIYIGPAIPVKSTGDKQKQGYNAMEVYDYIIGHAPIRPPEARHTEGKPELSQMMREDAKWIREEIVGMTMGQIIEAAADRGFFLSVLYELKPGILWHARFERNEFEPGKTRARQGSYASTAIEALYSAYEEIENPGINDERNMKAVGEKWAKIRALRGLDADPTVERNRDPYALEKLLLKHPGIAMRLEDAVRGLLNSLTGESDEDEWV